MADRNFCVICGTPDSWKHALLDCNFARCVWALEREEIVKSICSIQDTDAKGWLMEAFSTLANDELIWVVVTMWAIWYFFRYWIIKSGLYIRRCTQPIKTEFKRTVLKRVKKQ
jgi:hypothetical protein